MDMGERIAFMWNAENEYKCDRCPENRNKKTGGYPCGELFCWVTVYCEKDKACREEY